MINLGSSHTSTACISWHISQASLAANTARPWSALVTLWSHRWHRKPPEDVATWRRGDGTWRWQWEQQRRDVFPQNPWNLDELGTFNFYHVQIRGSQLLGRSPHLGGSRGGHKSWSKTALIFMLVPYLWLIPIMQRLSYWDQDASACLPLVQKHGVSWSS